MGESKACDHESIFSFFKQNKSWVKIEFESWASLNWSQLGWACSDLNWTEIKLKFILTELCLSWAELVSLLFTDQFYVFFIKISSVSSADGAGLWFEPHCGHDGAQEHGAGAQCCGGQGRAGGEEVSCTWTSLSRSSCPRCLRDWLHCATIIFISSVIISVFIFVRFLWSMVFR